jgi:tetratricopeptide (TPR) repeat protein
LAEVERTAFILTTMYNRVPHYFASLANAYANLAILLADSRPAESRIALASAKRVWRTAIAVMPDIETYQSGLRPNASDLAWFQQQFPDDAIDESNQGNATEGKSLRTDSHFTGIYLLNAGFTNKAVDRFEASLKQGPELQVFDWIYLAIAHRELGNTTTAESYFRQASEWIDENAPVDKELQELLESFELDIEERSNH